MSHVYDHVVRLSREVVSHRVEDAEDGTPRYVRAIHAQVDGGPVRLLKSWAVNGLTVYLTPLDGNYEVYDNADVGLLDPPAGSDKREGRGVYTARPPGRRTCVCVKNHVPVLHDDEAEGHHVWPLGEGGPDKPENMRWLCPITHTKVHNLWRAYQVHGGTPPNAVLRRYSSYVRDLVADGWRQAHPTPSPEV